MIHNPFSKLTNSITYLGYACLYADVDLSSGAWMVSVKRTLGDTIDD